MNKRVLMVLAIVLVGGAIVFGLVSKKDTTSTANTSNNSSQTQTKDQQSSTTPVSANEVSIENFTFGPADITVKKGTSVTWTNKDSTPHNVIGDGGKGPQSELLKQGDKYSYTFNETGKFSYICSIHPSMTGKVTVTE